MLLRYFWYFLWIFCPLLHVTVQAQVTILADSTELLIGDPLELRIVVNVPRGAQTVFPVLNSVLEDEEVIELLKQDQRIFTEGKVNDTYDWPITLTAWEPGQHALPALEVRYQYQDSVYKLRSLPFIFTAMAPQVTGDSVYVADIKTILTEEPNFWDYLYRLMTHPIVAVLFFLLLVFAAFYMLIQYKNRLQERKAKQSPEDWALEQLERLEAENYLAEHNFIAYHTAISKIVRIYLNRRFKIEALEQPTSYFLPQLQAHAYLQGSGLHEELSTVLAQADLIKYAKASPLPIANEKAAALIRNLVDLVRARLAEAEALKKVTARSSKSV